MNYEIGVLFVRPIALLYSSGNHAQPFNPFRFLQPLPKDNTNVAANAVARWVRPPRAYTTNDIPWVGRLSLLVPSIYRTEVLYCLLPLNRCRTIILGSKGKRRLRTTSTGEWSL
jgi:hypothetical protein